MPAAVTGGGVEIRRPAPHIKSSDGEWRPVTCSEYIFLIDFRLSGCSVDGKGHGGKEERRVAQTRVEAVQVVRV